MDRKSSLHLEWRSEDLPGEAWREQFDWSWESYRGWFLREGDKARPSLNRARRALRLTMPELIPVWERLVELSGGGDMAARMLSLYRPTPFLAGCSQAVFPGSNPVLFRNYDYDPTKFEGVFLHSAWHGTQVIATSDCLWGVLDGVNEHGLSVALSFGGRREIGSGFGIPLILRYVLEFCTTLKEAVEVLKRVPSHMAYNVSVLDSTGAHVVVWMKPGGGAEIVDAAVATNHQGRPGWSAYARATASLERERFLLDQVAVPGLTRERLESSFLEAPLYMSRPEKGFCTLYTAGYEPATGSVDYLWPGIRVRQSMDSFTPMTRQISLASGHRNGAAL